MMLIGAGTIAQTTEDFESVILLSESYDNGSAGAGDFIFTDLTFTNVYNAQWSSWTGFSISNVTDVTTAGFGNQYAAFTGGGYNSTNFAMFYQSGMITATSMGTSIDSLKITNATYTAISMRDGDAFGKQFGSPNDANGNPDGTNGEDFLFVWAIGENSNGSQKDSVQFYLADYRFADNTQDYIIDTWETLDFSNFSFPVRKVNFRIESSDVGQFINTPTYFAVDDVSTKNILSVEDKMLSNIKVYPNPINDLLVINGEFGDLIITAANGSIIYSGVHNGHTELNVSSLNSGVYFVQLMNENGSFVTKVVK